MFDFSFAMRPSTICNMQCSYCYRKDYLVGNKQSHYDIDSMLWHSFSHPNNLFNFCGLGETMLHPQFPDMIIELSQITKVNWVTNGTCFESKGFERILNKANLSNIYDIVISIHFGQIKDIQAFSTIINKAFYNLTIRGIKVHLTSILTDDNVDDIIEYRYLFPNLVIKHPFDIYIQNGKVVRYSYSQSTIDKITANNLNVGSDYSTLTYPYIGKVCPNGSKIVEVMSDGEIYDCSFDENRILIGNINVREPILTLQYPRICKSICYTCIPYVKDGFGFINKPDISC